MKIKSPEELEKIAINYFEDCAEKGNTVCITGFCVFAGTYRDYLSKLVDNKPEFIDIVKRIREIIAFSYENGGLTGKIPVAQAIFLQKNMGFSDRMEIDQRITGDISLSQILTEAQSRKRIEQEPEDFDKLETGDNAENSAENNAENNAD